MADQLPPGQLSDEDIQMLHAAAVAKQKALMAGQAGTHLTQANVGGDDAAQLGMGRGDLSAGLGTSAADADAYLDRLAQDAALRKATGATGSQSPANPMQVQKDPNTGQPVPSPNVIPGKSASPTGAANSVPGQSAPPVGGKLGPGVQMDPNVTIKVGPQSSMLEPRGPSGSDMPDPHAPEPQDEEPDEDDDGDMPIRFGRG